MGARYLTELADWLRAAGLAVVEYDGWQTRARSSGGYDTGRPTTCMWHHTASRASALSDATYMCRTSADRPIANLLVARDGAVWVLAAGASNTNGRGGPVTIPPGVVVPLDSMNTHAVGMEIANDGVGETYPQVQIDAAFTTSLTVCARLGLPVDAVCIHGGPNGWAPTRKIDPAQAGAVAGPWRPRAVGGAGTWSLDDLRAELRARSSLPPVPPPTPEVHYLIGMPTLRKGVTGQGVAVCCLQSLLNYRIGAGLTLDGDFGSKTDGKVREYQKITGLTVDGVAGAVTWDRLGY